MGIFCCVLVSLHPSGAFPNKMSWVQVWGGYEAVRFPPANLISQNRPLGPVLPASPRGKPRALRAGVLQRITKAPLRGIIDTQPGRRGHEHALRTAIGT